MINKKNNAKGDSVRVTFEVPGEAAQDSLAIVGSFNDWDATADQMKMVKSRGVWKKEITFPKGENVEFRYYADGGTWMNEDEADRQVRNEYGGENSVLEL